MVNCVVGDGGSVDKGSWEEATLIVRWLWIYFLSFFNQRKDNVIFTCMGNWERAEGGWGSNEN